MGQVPQPVRVSQPQSHSCINTLTRHQCTKATPNPAQFLPQVGEGVGWATETRTL